MPRRLLCGDQDPPQTNVRTEAARYVVYVSWEVQHFPSGLRERKRGESEMVSWSNGDTLILYTNDLTEATRDVLAGIVLLDEAARQFKASLMPQIPAASELQH